MIEKINNKGRIYKYLQIFYEYSDNIVFNYFIEKTFEIVINCIKHYYLSDKSKLDFFKEDSKIIAKKLTNPRNRSNIFLDEIEDFLF